MSEETAGGIKTTRTEGSNGERISEWNEWSAMEGRKMKVSERTQ